MIRYQQRALEAQLARELAEAFYRAGAKDHASARLEIEALHKSTSHKKGHKRHKRELLKLGSYLCAFVPFWAKLLWLFALILCCGRLARGRFRQCVKLVAIRDVKHAVGGHGSRVNRAAHIDLAEHLLRLAFLQDHDVAIFVAEVELAVNQHRRAPDCREDIVRPVHLTCLRIKAVQEAAEISLVDDSVLDGRR